MCGLIGILQERPTRTRVDVDRALATIAHRGPDHMASWSSADGRMALGHVRLSIIGLDNGAQPLVNPWGDVRAVVNGELYEYRQIRAEMHDWGYHFSTGSDSEVALALYTKLGLNFVHHLRGEYAIVIADQRRGQVLAVRDRFGIKPLFYAEHRGDVMFASEIKALLALGVPARWDAPAFVAECHGARTADRTLFDGIRAVPPGCFAIARDGRVEIVRYWDLDFPSADELAADRRTDGEVVDEFRQILDDAVAERLVADVEVASYLSGGIDSCAVLGLAQAHATRPIKAFTIAFGDDRYDEHELAQRAAERAGAVFVPVPVTQMQLAERFSDALWHTESLVFNGHGVAKFLLSEAVRDAGIKVVFTGEGADEMLAGYPPFRRDAILHERGGLAADVDRRLAALAAANQSSRGLLSADGVAAPGLDIVASRLGWVPSYLEANATLAAKLLPLLRCPAGVAAGETNPYGALLDDIDLAGQVEGRDPINQALYLWARTQLPNYILTFLGDRMEMAHSVEGRVPFLDHHVAEYAAGLPIHHKIRDGCEKHVLREAVRDYVPAEVVDRPKHPFMSPPARSADDAFGAYCQDVLRSDAVDDQPFFDPRRVRTWMDSVAALAPDDRAAQEGAVLRVVSTVVLQQRFTPTA